jgi:uncharacterized protein
MGGEVFRPESPDTGEYRIVYRFDTAQHLRAWLDSDEHAAWLERAEPHAIGPVHTRFVTGLESWFTLPGRPGTLPPPPYKMALLTWITIFPLITLVVELLGPLLEELSEIPRLGITTAVTVPLMTWVVMPRVTRLLRGWLYPRHRPSTPTPQAHRLEEGMATNRQARDQHRRRGSLVSRPARRAHQAGTRR